MKYSFLKGTQISKLIAHPIFLYMYVFRILHMQYCIHAVLTSVEYFHLQAGVMDLESIMKHKRQCRQTNKWKCFLCQSTTTADGKDKVSRKENLVIPDT